MLSLELGQQQQYPLALKKRTSQRHSGVLRTLRQKLVSPVSLIYTRRCIHLLRIKIKRDKYKIVWQHHVYCKGLLVPAVCGTSQTAQPYRYQCRSTENTVIMLVRGLCGYQDTKWRYLVNVPVLTEYMMSRLMSVSDLSEVELRENKKRVRLRKHTFLYPVLIL